MSSPEARGLTEEWIAEHGDPDRDDYIPPDPEHWRQQEEALDRFLAEHPFPAGSPGAQRRAALEVPFDRARFDDSIELAHDQLAFPLPDREPAPLRTDRRLVEQMQRVEPTANGPALVGWTYAATDAELLEVNRERVADLDKGLGVEEITYAEMNATADELQWRDAGLSSPEPDLHRIGDRRESEMDDEERER